jgi:hypothetical protein
MRHAGRQRERERETQRWRHQPKTMIRERRKEKTRA